MDIKRLKYFLTIAEEGSITGAAKKLYMFQPPLSQQLKLLEEELEVELFERRNKKIYLTEAGRMLQNRAEQILELTESTLKEFKDWYCIHFRSCSYSRTYKQFPRKISRHEFRNI